MTWTPTWWQWVLVYLVAGLLITFLAVPVIMACEAARDAIGRRLPWSAEKQARRRLMETHRRYSNGECYCPIHGWMLKADAGRHTQMFHSGSSRGVS